VIAFSAENGCALENAYFAGFVDVALWLSLNYNLIFPVNSLPQHWIYWIITPKYKVCDLQIQVKI